MREDSRPGARFAKLFALAAVLALPPSSLVAVTEMERYLEMDLAQLMQVTVTTAAKKEQTLADTAAAVHVITQENIRRSGVTSVAAALALAPGVQVARISASRWSVSVRGFAGYTSNKLLVLIDGRSVYSPAYSGTFWDMQQVLLEDVERIEVIRGPGATVWGANAVNGVINIITKSARDTEGTLLRAGLGSEERAQVAMRHGFRQGESSHGRFYLTGSDHDASRQSDRSGDGGDGWRNLQSGFRFDGAMSDSQWTLQGDTFRNSGDQLLYPYWLDHPPYRVAKAEDLDSRGANLRSRWQQRLAGDRLLSLNLYYDYSERGNDFNFAFHTLDGELQYEWTLAERHAVSVGLGYRHIAGDHQATFQSRIPERSDNLYSLFLQDSWRLFADGWFLTLGGKWQDNAYTGNEWQPSAKLLWKMSERESGWLSLARAVRTPSTMEHQGRLVLFSAPGENGVQTVALAGRDDYRSESVLAYEAGYRAQVHSDLTFDLALFYNDYRDIYTLTPQPAADGIDMAVVNNGEGRGYGGEVAIDWRALSWLHCSLAYSYLRARFDWQEPGIAVDNLKTFIERLTPRHQVSLGATVDLAKAWELNGWLRYVDAIETRSSEELLEERGRTIDDYWLLDVNAVWRPSKGFSLTLAGQNLLDNRQVQYVAEIHTPSMAIERGVYLKATWSY